MKTENLPMYLSLFVAIFIIVAIGCLVIPLLVAI